MSDYFQNSVETGVRKKGIKTPISPSAVRAVRDYLGEYVIQTLKIADACREHGSRESLEVEDLLLIETIRRRRKDMN